MDVARPPGAQGLGAAGAATHGPRTPRRRACSPSRARTCRSRRSSCWPPAGAAAGSSRAVVQNDAFALLRAGTDRGWGVAVVCGAGINAVGVGPDGTVVRFPALGAISGGLGRRARRGLRGARGRGARPGRARAGRPCSRPPYRPTSGCPTRWPCRSPCTRASCPRPGSSSCPRCCSTQRGRATRWRPTWSCGSPTEVDGHRRRGRPPAGPARRDGDPTSCWAAACCGQACRCSTTRSERGSCSAAPRAAHGRRPGADRRRRPARA